MNIKEAIERVAGIDRNENQVSNLSQLMRAPRFTVKVFTSEYRNDVFEIHADLLLAAMHESVKRDWSEVDKLKSVINMANAALKGLDV